MRWTPRASLLFALAFAALPSRAADQSKSISEIPESAVTPSLSPQTPAINPTAAPGTLPTALPNADLSAGILPTAQATAQAQAAKPSAQAQVQAAAKGAETIRAALSPAKAGDGTTAAVAQGRGTFDRAQPHESGSLDGPAVPGSFSQPASGLAPYAPRAPLAQESAYTRERGLAAMLDDAVSRGDLPSRAKQAWLDTAYRDPLTGLRNRLYLEDHLSELVGKNRTLITIKLDALKEINDSYDHEVGNKFLKSLGAVASSVLGSDAALIRRSPTGFAIFIDQPPARARLVAEALRAAVAQKIGDPGSLLPGTADRNVGGTISLGVAPITQNAASPAEAYAAAYASAERARVLAKESGGGNRVALAEADGPRLVERLSLDETAARLRGSSPRFSARLEVARDQSLARLTAAAGAGLANAPRAAELLSAIKSPELQRALFETVYLDRLSGLPNRRWLFDHLGVAVGPGGFTHYIALDLDRFGTINERFGEDKADAVLQELGKLLSESTRGEDALALHLSGEEFVILSRGGDPRSLAERVRVAVRDDLGKRAVRRGVLDLSDGTPLTMTASFGVGEIRRDGGDEEHVLTLATAMSEAMLQRAKDNGRDRVEGAEDLEALLKRVIRVDDTARRAVQRALAVVAPKTPPIPSDELFNNAWRSRKEVLAALGYNPAREWGDLLSEIEKGGQEVYRIAPAGKPSRVIKVGPRNNVSNELFARNVLRGFEIFSESLYAPDAVAYYRGPFFRPILVMEDLGQAPPSPIDWSTLPLHQKRALALFAMTFGIHGFNGKALVRPGWERSAIVDFEYDRYPLSDSPSTTRMPILSETPWVSGSYINDLADYHDAIERWKKDFARPETQTELIAMLRRSQVPEVAIPVQLGMFQRNLDRLERGLAADIAVANQVYFDDCRRSGMDRGQAEALSNINKAAQTSPQGGLARDIVRFLNRRVLNYVPPWPTIVLRSEEFHHLAVRRQRGLTDDDRTAVIRAAEAGRLGTYTVADVRRALRELDAALPPSRD